MTSQFGTVVMFLHLPQVIFIFFTCAHRADRMFSQIAGKRRAERENEAAAKKARNEEKVYVFFVLKKHMHPLIIEVKHDHFPRKFVMSAVFSFSVFFFSFCVGMCLYLC